MSLSLIARTILQSPADDEQDNATARMVVGSLVGGLDGGPRTKCTSAGLDTPRGRDHATFPGARPPRYEQPAWKRGAGHRLSQAGARERGHSRPDLRQRAEPAQSGRADQGEREEAAHSLHGPHRRRHGRSEEVDLPAFQRHSQWRLRVRSRSARRQAARRRRSHDAARVEAAQCGPRSRRHLPGRIRRGRHDGSGHRLHDARARR